MPINSQKEAALPVGAAITRLIKLQFFRHAGVLEGLEREREMQNLVEALNAFEINLSFDCETDAELQQAVEAAETALDVLLCDAETQCCRIADKAASEANRPRRLTSSRGD